MKPKRRRPLRLLLFVIPVVIGLLSGLAYAALAGARRRAMRVYCEGTLRSLGYTLHLYTMDYGEAFPPTLGRLYPQYAPSVVFLCPSARKATRLEDEFRSIELQDSNGERTFSYRETDGTSTFIYPDTYPDTDGVVYRELIGSNEPCYTPAKFGDTHTDYVYVSGLTADDPGRYVIAFDDEWNHDGDGVHLLYIGSNVEWVSDIRALHGQLAKQEKELAAKGREMKLIRPAWSSWPGPPVGGHPLAGPRRRPWYERPSGRSVVVGVIASVVTALALVIIRTVRQGRKPGSGDAAQPER